MGFAPTKKEGKSSLKEMGEKEKVNANKFTYPGSSCESALAIHINSEKSVTSEIQRHLHL